MLSLKGVSASYGVVRVLKEISLEVAPGEVVTIIGANGAGKTTTLMTISGIVPACSGTITFCGREIQHRPSHEIVAEGICHVPEGRRIFPRLTVLENLEMGAFLQKGAKVKEEMAEEVFTLFPVLAERRRQLGGTLSGGEQQMLAIGRALMGRPKMLILDEPSLGLAPVMVEKIFELIEKIRQQGKTLLIVEQNAVAALTLANRGYVMEAGQIILSDTADRLMENPRVQRAYLGGN
jgi:branched-chain amino acid transport system ATP-binding protein